MAYDVKVCQVCHKGRLLGFIHRILAWSAVTDNHKTKPKCQNVVFVFRSLVLSKEISYIKAVKADRARILRHNTSLNAFKNPSYA